MFTRAEFILHVPCITDEYLIPYLESNNYPILELVFARRQNKFSMSGTQASSLHGIL